MNSFLEVTTINWQIFSAVRVVWLFLSIIACMTILLFLEYRAIVYHYGQVRRYEKWYHSYLVHSTFLLDYAQEKVLKIFSHKNPILVSALQPAWLLSEGQVIYPFQSEWFFSTPVPAKKSLPRRKIKKSFLSTFTTSMGLFQWPIERSSFWLSSRFGPRRKKSGSWGYHYGIDMAAPKGTPVIAVASGTIIEAGYSKKGYGKTIVVAHSDTIYRTRYAHLDVILVKPGQHINVGSCIGFVGDTGFVRSENGSKNASHLHFEVKKRGRYIDPLCVLM